MPEPIRVLVVDDRPDVRLSFLFLLQALGFAVAEAADGAAALSYLMQQPVDIVLVDLCMPGLDGLGLIKIMRRLPRKASILAMTGAANLCTGVTRDAAIVAGAADVLEKPVPRDKLKKALLDVLRDDPRIPPGLRTA